jgi:hypothetical protein
MPSIDNVEDVEPRIQYVASAGQTVFAVPFPFFTDADLVVDVDGVVKTLTTQYTVTGAEEDAGGEVTFLGALTGGEIVTIYRDIAIERTADFQTNGPLRSTTFNDELDKITLILQQLESRIGRALRMAINSQQASDDLVLDSAFEGKYLFINSEGELEPSTAVAIQTLTQSIIGALLYPRTAAEVAAGVTPLDYGYAPGVFERYGATGDGVTDDTLALQSAFKVGRTVKGTPGRSYLITDALYCSESDTVADLRGCTITQATAGTSFLHIGRTAASSTFVKTDRVRIIGGRFTGAVTGGGSAAYGITINQPTDNPYVNGSGCDDIEISGVSLSGFTGGVIATGASNVRIHHSRFGTMVYHSGLSAGGYGVLLQTCFAVSIDNNYFKAGTTSRHAMYISADPTRISNNDNVCKQVSVTGNVIDWTGTSGATGFETSMALRAVQNLTVTGNTITGGYGQIDYTCDNGDGYNLVIAGNTLRGLLGRGAINVFRSTGSFTNLGVAITGNSIHVDGAGFDGITVTNADGVTVTGNSVNAETAGDLILFTDCNNVTVGGNTLIANTAAASAVGFAGTCDGIAVNRNHIDGSYTKIYRYYSNPTNIKFGYARTLSVVSDGAGGLTITDDDDIVAAVASNASGLDITFENWVEVNAIAARNVGFAVANSSVCTIYHRSRSGQVLTVGVANFAGAAMPAATNAYTVGMQLYS